MRHIIVLGIILISMIGVGLLSAPATAQQGPALCLKTCMETYGADKKQACALQCGYGQGNAGGGQSRDCGVIYKQCLRSCANDNACKSNCRKQRTSCY